MKMKNNESASIPVEMFMTRYFIKYTRMDQLIQYAFAGSSATKIDLFIDIYGIYKSIFSRHYVTNITDYTVFTSTLINMCGHYRTYFKKLGVQTNIFLVSSYNIPEINSKFVAGYNKIFKEKINNKLIYDMVEQNIQLLEIMCPYLPQIYFIKSEFESSVAIYNIIKKEKSYGRDVPSIIISADSYPIQLTTILDDVAYIRPKKAMGEDISEIICPKSHFQHQISFWRMICQEKDEFVLNESTVCISSRNYVLLAALNRFPDRGITALVNFTKANKIINSITNGSDITVTPDMLTSADESLITGLPLQLVESRYKALDVLYQDIIYNDSSEPLELSFIDLEDNNAIQLINDQYFSLNPIDIYKL